MNPVEEKILIATKAMFMRYGIKSITMDDVAREMAISKKTLYQHFSDKNDLVKRVVEGHLEFVCQECTRTFEEKANPIDQILEISSMRAQEMNLMNPSLIYDLKKYYPESWALLEKYKHEFIYNQIRQNLSKGISMGLYREEVKIDIVSRFYVYLVDIVMDADGKLKSLYNTKELHREMITYHLRAVSTKKGLDHLNKRLNEPDKQ